MPDKHNRPPSPIETPDDFEVALPPGELLPEHYLNRKLTIHKPWLVLLLSLLTGLALTLCFNVPGLAWLAFFALVPWVLATVTCVRTPWAMFGSFLLGLVFWMVNVHWIIPVTIAGYLGTCLYLSSYFLLGGWLLRHCYQRRRLPFFIMLPLIWVGLELLRGHVITGFSWLLLGHSQYRWIRLIQIADLVGAYGVSFLVAMVNGFIVDLLAQPLFVRTKQGSRPSLVAAAGVVSLIGLAVFTLIYGTTQMNFGPLSDGPKVAVIQENFPISVTRASQNDREVFDAYRKLTTQANQTHHPDIIVWPESMAQPFLYPKVPEQASQRRFTDSHNGEYVQKELSKLARQVNAHLLVGSSARTYTRQPDSLNTRISSYNSAFLARPDGLILHQRYDKMHLVPFAEYIPLRKTFPPLLELVKAVGPYDFDHSLEHGSSAEIFAVTIENTQSSFRFATPICYEGTVADLCRSFVLPENQPKIDFLLNVSNDGWFNASWELSQHLVCYVFRAVENRVPIARAVNTGISGFVDSTGRLHDLVTQDSRIRGVAGFACARLRIDPRITIYSQTGDFFALLCGFAALAVFIDSLRGPSKHRRARVLLVLLTIVMLADAVGRWLF